MVTTKKARKPTKKTTKKILKKASKARARVETGPVPPYGDPIRGAIARGDVQEMRSVAANARKWLADVQSALAQLESAIKKSG
jgi:Domain of unknown function (DUF1843)